MVSTARGAGLSELPPCLPCSLAHLRLKQSSAPYFSGNTISISCSQLLAIVHSGHTSRLGRDTARGSHCVGQDQRVYSLSVSKMTTHLPSQDAWSRARNRYIEDLTQEEKQSYLQATPETIFYDASAAEKSHEASSHSRGLMNKLQPFVAAIEQYGRALDIYSNAYPLALSPLWGSIRVLLRVLHSSTASIGHMLTSNINFRLHGNSENTLRSSWTCLPG